eukprot:UN09196
MKLLKLKLDNLKIYTGSCAWCTGRYKTKGNVVLQSGLYNADIMAAGIEDGEIKHQGWLYKAGKNGAEKRSDGLCCIRIKFKYYKDQP